MGRLDIEKMNRVIDIPIHEASYISGVFDGEGSICLLSMNRGGRSPSFNLLIQITNSGIEMLEFVHQRLGGSLFPIGKGHRMGRKPLFRWQQGGYACAPMLRVMRPHLIEKRQQCVLGLAYLELGNTWNLEQRFEMYRKMKELNGQGRGAGPRKYPGEVLSLDEMKTRLPTGKAPRGYVSVEAVST